MARPIRHSLLSSILATLVFLTACDSGQKGPEAGEEASTPPTETLEPMATTPADDDHHPAVEGRDIDDITADLHATLMTVDTHVDIPDTFATDEVDPGERGRFQVDLVKMVEGNLNTVFFVVYVGQKERNEKTYAEATAKARNKFDAIHRMTDELHSDKIEMAFDADDVDRIRASGKLVALIGVENGFAFGSDASTAEDYYNRGMRYAGFAHIGHSNFADSSWPRPDIGDGDEEHGGLSDEGRALLSELNRLGVMADVSHSSKAATLEIARTSKAPVIASHSGAFGVYDHVRNLSDEELIAIKDGGGVVQAVGFDGYVKAPPAEKKAATDALKAKYEYTRANRGSLSKETIKAYRAELETIHETWPRSNVSDFVDHIDYMVALIGIDHVGISSDFDGGGGLTGWMNASETPSVTKELISRGYSVGEIKKLWGKNLMRVMAEVEAKAER